MRVVRIPAPLGDRDVLWERVIDVRYRGKGASRYIVLVYPYNSERELEIHQARDLWYEISEPAGCEFPCYFRREAETPPTNCTECLLCDRLKGVLPEDLRPPAIPARVVVVDRRNVIIVALVALVMLLTAAIVQMQSPTPPLSRTPYNAGASERGAKRTGMPTR